ncbi:MAG: hypothetical protein KDC98_07010, partial [Planctomycetes bacterium]|nr:hypothetical protein [Planctomycetota bacterium]
QSAVLEVFIADDNDGNLNNGTPHHPQLAAACNAHSLPYPAIQAGSLTHSAPLHDTDAPLTPRFVECDAVPVFGSFTQVRLHYNDGQQRQRVMIPTATANRYRALLPGMPSPQTLTYHFEGVHSANITFRLPETGEYSYATYSHETIWSEDFETGGPGWTHGANVGSDDWQIGVPGGFGAGPWADPATAASGTRCAGTDLWNDGAYSPSSDSWLRSPPIDCTGQTNLKLRLKRWVSCPLTFNDSLELRVNGILIWNTPYNQFIENQWVTFEWPIWMAYNHPAVVIEFRLRSDATEEYGGWNIDDLEIFTPTSTTPLSTTLSMAPEQAQQGSPLNLAIRTPASQPFLLAIGSQPGPTVFPGVPPILVGGNYVTFAGFTDATGNYSLPLSAPGSVPLTGTVWYSQALTIDSAFQLVTSNQFINLFTQ